MKTPKSMIEDSSQQATSDSLIQRAQRSDIVAWERLARLYSPLVYRWARRAGLQPDDASDVMQDVFETLATRLSQFQRRNASDSFRGWLYTVSRNKLRDHFRDKRAEALPLGGSDAQQMWQELPDAATLARRLNPQSRL